MTTAPYSPDARRSFALYEVEEGSDDPRAIQGGGGASERYLRTIRATPARLAAFLRAYHNRYGDSLVIRSTGARCRDMLDGLEKLLRQADNNLATAMHGERATAKKRRDAINAACNAMHRAVRA